MTTGSGNEALRLDGVRRVYGTPGNQVTALDGVSVRLPACTFTAVMGPSGSGKSTFLQVAGALVPIILLTGSATGTFYLQNFVVVGMIAVFAAIMLINTLVAATIHRRREFGQQRLIGSTPPQVLGMVGIEGAVLTVTGVLFGSVAAVVAVLPYSYAKTGSVLPGESIGIYLGVIAVAAVLTFAASLGAASRAIRTPAVQAVAA